MRNVLVTGAAGNIGSYFAQRAHQRYRLRLMVHRPAPELEPFGEVVVADLADLDRMKEVCAGMDTVVHLAGNPDPNAVWADLVTPNIFGCYNVFVAAKACNCRRVIFASSIHAVSGYPPDVQVKTGEAVNPGDLYGVTKCFGEALGRYMAEQEGLSVIAIRIGAFQPRESALKGGIEMMDAFLSRRDMQQLLEKCIDVEALPWALLHGLSDNRFKRLDLSDTRRLVGFEPHDDLTELSPELRDLRLAERVAANSLMDDRQESGLREELGQTGDGRRETGEVGSQGPHGPQLLHHRT